MTAGPTRDTNHGPILKGLGLVALLLLGAGCSTDDNVGGFQTSCLTFLATMTPVDGEVTSVWGAESTCETAQVELVIPGGVNGVWGASFHVTYDNSLAVFAGMSTTDSFLRQDGNLLVSHFEDDQNGTVVIGVDRSDSANNVGVAPLVDNTLIARLFFFRIATSGSGPVGIVNANLWKVENLGDPPTEFNPPIPFSAGDFDIEN